MKKTRKYANQKFLVKLENFKNQESGKFERPSKIRKLKRTRRGAKKKFLV